MKLTLVRIFLFGLLPYLLSAGSMHVPGTYPTLQAALDDANPGDTIRAAEGAYPETLLWPSVQGIVLIAEGGPESTVIDAGGAGRTVTFFGFLDSTTVLRGFTITGGYAPGKGTEGNGGGILCGLLSSPTLEENVILGNVAMDRGGGIACENGASPRIVWNRITENAANIGGGISLTDSDARVEGNLIQENECNMHGGGIFLSGGANPTVQGNEIRSNRSGIGGGIACLDGARCRIVDNFIDGNVSNDGGGIACYHGSSPQILRNAVVFNHAFHRGGGINCYAESSPSIRETRISDNVADVNGGAVSCFTASSPCIVRCEILLNEGNGVHCSKGSSPTIDSCRLEGNTELAVLNDDTLEVQARHNYWGHPSGPAHPTEYPQGSGDRIRGAVIFTPWLKEWR
jgi:hypothetical protein